MLQLFKQIIPGMYFILLSNYPDSVLRDKVQAIQTFSKRFFSLQKMIHRKASQARMQCASACTVVTSSNSMYLKVLTLL